MTEEEARAEYSEMLPALRDFRAQLLSRLSSLPLTSSIDIRSRIKAWEAIREKLKRKNFDRVSDIYDLIGLRLIVPDIITLSRVREEVARHFLVPSMSAQHLGPSQSSVHLVVRNVTSLTAGVSAEIQILTAAEEARQAVEHELNYDRSAATDNAHGGTDSIEILDRVITEFEQLIGQADVHEKRDVHPFLLQHLFLILPNPDAIVSERPLGLGTEYRIDFLIRHPDGTYTLVEIENPQRPMVTQSGDFSHHVNHALCQVEDWQDWIEANIGTVERYYPGMRAPEAWVVIGRDNPANDELQQRRIKRRNINMRGRIKIRTYDDLIRDARAYVRSIRNALTNGAG